MVAIIITLSLSPNLLQTKQALEVYETALEVYETSSGIKVDANLDRYLGWGFGILLNCGDSWT